MSGTGWYVAASPVSHEELWTPNLVATVPRRLQYPEGGSYPCHSSVIKRLTPEAISSGLLRAQGLLDGALATLAAGARIAHINSSAAVLPGLLSRNPTLAWQVADCTHIRERRLIVALAAGDIA